MSVSIRRATLMPRGEIEILLELPDQDEPVVVTVPATDTSYRYADLDPWEIDLEDGDHLAVERLRRIVLDHVRMLSRMIQQTAPRRARG